MPLIPPFSPSLLTWFPMVVVKWGLEDLSRATSEEKTCPPALSGSTSPDPFTPWGREGGGETKWSWSVLSDYPLFPTHLHVHVPHPILLSFFPPPFFPFLSPSSLHPLTPLPLPMSSTSTCTCICTSLLLPHFFHLLIPTLSYSHLTTPFPSPPPCSHSIPLCWRSHTSVLRHLAPRSHSRYPPALVSREGPGTRWRISSLQAHTHTSHNIHSTCT